jgi:type I restriction enzyme S subunit
MVQLGEVCEFIRGVTFDKADATTQPEVGKTPVLRAGNIGEELDAQNDLVWVPDAQVSVEKLLRQNDIAICMSSGSPEVVGKTARVPCNLRASIGSFCGIIRPKTPDEASYLSFFFRSAAFKKHRNAIARGANIQNLRFSQFEEIDLEIPSGQRQIAERLEQVDRLRRTRRYALELTDTFLPAAFLKLFGDPGESTQTYDRVQVEDLFADSRGGAKCGPFGSALKKHEYVTEGIPVWTMNNVGAKEFLEDGCLYITPEKFEELAAYDTQNGDILISRAGTVGRMAIVRTKHPQSIIHSNIIRLSLNHKKILPIYFVVLMTWFAPRIARLKRGQEDAYTFMSTGSLGELQIPLPPFSLQEKFADLVEELEHLRAVQREALRQAEHLFQTLLHQAFSESA